MTQGAHIVATAVRCAVGLTAESAAAAIRAGISRVAEHPFMVDAAGEKLLCARDAGFAAGLLEALTQCAVEGTPVLLVVYDTEYPQPLYAKRQIPDTMGIAMTLAPRRSERSLARIGLDRAAFLTPAVADTMADPALEALRQSIPVARALPLLGAIAKREARSIALDYLDPLQFTVEVAPC